MDRGLGVVVFVVGLPHALLGFHRLAHRDWYHVGWWSQHQSLIKWLAGYFQPPRRTKWGRRWDLYNAVVQLTVGVLFACGGVAIVVGGAGR